MLVLLHSRRTDIDIKLVCFIVRTFVEDLYVPPQITYDEEIDDLLDDYMNDYRRVYIEHPRIRLDGVYIAVCHYMCVHHPQRNIFIFILVRERNCLLRSHRSFQT